MSAGSATERRRGERRRADEQRFWRALNGERRVGERRREVDGTRVAAESVVEAEAASRTVAAPPGAASPDTPPAHPDLDPDLDPDAERRAALRQMLRAAEARQDRASRARRPVLGQGARVRVLRGELAGQLATVADADYIHARVLIDPDGDAPPRWVPFGRVGAV